jgi:hypothetical protein
MYRLHPILVAVVGVFPTACSSSNAAERLTEVMDVMDVSFAEKVDDPLTYVVDVSAFGAVASGPAVKSTCGFQLDFEHVRLLEKYREHAATVAQLSPRIGALAAKEFDSFRPFCSGILVSERRFLTASHCVDSAIKKRVVVFGHERTSTGETAAILRRDVLGVVVDGIGRRIDYALLEIEPVNDSNVSPLSLGDAQKELVGVLQHPRGGLKQVAFGEVKHTSEQTFTYEVDTAKSSSGGPVFRADGSLAGIHVAAGCTVLAGANVGVPIALIMDDIERHAPAPD